MIAMKPDSIFLLSIILLSLVAACENGEKGYTQGTIKTRIDFTLDGFTFKTLKASSLLLRGQLCLKHQRCMSTNFKLLTVDKEGVCELNTAGLLDNGNEKTLVPHNGVVFSRYAKKEHFGCHGNPRERNKDFAYEFPTTTDAAFLLERMPNHIFTELTICFWMKTTNSEEGTPLSYTTVNSKTEIVISDYRNFKVYIGKKSGSISWQYYDSHCRLENSDT